ncbi:MAG: hypothetical protein UT61_C0053G0002 [Candidatus Woesebacteria bacterium GW2011_GWA1_39_8]|jgi:hypothetical protein|uniref:Uncharacterized protein n=1 Tax=Candidatus Woesebacteria bacterium GW2011_GWA1_39_8 TaxID=1618552 RepID=A0A0G0PT64_9BACT|nr:MAG: hypothetical protein UT61_C0053G0002 [Candidatus Woesebacteria bacterium GW2011_GWA1_39_8]
MNIQLANLSTDLRRISNWLYEGKIGFVNNYIVKIRDKYQIDNPVGPYDDVWKEIALIAQGHEGRLRSADRATTLSSILLQEALKSEK